MSAQWGDFVPISPKRGNGHGICGYKEYRFKECPGSEPKNIY